MSDTDRELERDAARYRWLRERKPLQNPHNTKGGRIQVYQFDGERKRRSNEATAIFGEALDAAVDEALARMKEGR